MDGDGRTQAKDEWRRRTLSAIAPDREFAFFLVEVIFDERIKQRHRGRLLASSRQVGAESEIRIGSHCGVTHYLTIDHARRGERVAVSDAG